MVTCVENSKAGITLQKTDKKEGIWRPSKTIKASSQCLILKQQKNTILKKIKLSCWINGRYLFQLWLQTLIVLTFFTPIKILILVMVLQSVWQRKFINHLNYHAFNRFDLWTLNRNKVFCTRGLSIKWWCTFRVP